MRCPDCASPDDDARVTLRGRSAGGEPRASPIALIAISVARSTSRRARAARRERRRAVRRDLHATAPSTATTGGRRRRLVAARDLRASSTAGLLHIALQHVRAARGCAAASSSRQLGHARSSAAIYFASPARAAPFGALLVTRRTPSPSGASGRDLRPHRRRGRRSAAPAVLDPMARRTSARSSSSTSILTLPAVERDLGRRPHRRPRSAAVIAGLADRGSGRGAGRRRSAARASWAPAVVSVIGAETAARRRRSPSPRGPVPVA